MIDYQSRFGATFTRKPVSKEERQQRSETMKAFNRKTGKLTKLGNNFTARSGKAKGNPK